MLMPGRYLDRAHAYRVAGDISSLPWSWTLPRESARVVDAFLTESNERRGAAPPPASCSPQ